ncbi:hypothetical protein EN827_07080 [Mesorhizobium sp. M1D.F.Ca.ET.184.01.1.1]|nr:hypothetical protein EN874_007080 [Mesorhizobium sp. M1D.F.Ca.ET.231.01.1.1]TGP36209.1 hypothetical protein EN877_07080 [Mesorhizobium sp. M1D.F.Ca.ET.234.01.1.1]TGS49711.1 hypothetical protein EN827_07080 [Mesorhizobium sp. M1D.F.Ca.ET.184.01.1.1]TGS64423.1 hypothetical protein EN826_007080 [Mesorhizobium sp. M1D.F.Ca.ET.183.01.1.1]
MDQACRRVGRRVVHRPVFLRPGLRHAVRPPSGRARRDYRYIRQGAAQRARQVEEARQGERDAQVRVIIIAAVAAYVLLLLSNSGVLVGSELVQADPVRKAAGEAQDYFHCRYFTGRSVVEIDFWYSPNGFMGRAQCPFLVRL